MVGHTCVAAEIASAKFVNLFRVGTVNVHTQTRQLGHCEFPSGTNVQNLAIVRLFSKHEPNDGFLALIDIVCVPAGGDQTNGVELQEFSLQDFIACRCNCHEFHENFDNSDLVEIPPEILARLAQHGDVILTVFFQYAPVIKCLRPLRLVPLQKFLPL
jgi:hypothetical protein